MTSAAQFWAELESQAAQRRLKPFVIHFGNRYAPRLRMSVMAESRQRAAEQHEHLAIHGERVDVLTPEEAKRISGGKA